MIQQDKILLTREAIASRMFRNAAKQWGLTDSNIDSFDPLVRMLIEACAVEMYRLSNQIESVEERMINKLAGLLTPQVYVLPRPAHGVMHARGVEAESFTSKKMQFFYQKKISSKPNGPLDSNVDIFFSPSGAYKVIDGDVKYIATGNSIFAVNEEGQHKELLARTSASLPYRTAWIGIEHHADIESVAGLSIFFDLKNTPEKHRYLSLIPFTHCSVNGTPIHFKEGVLAQDEAAKQDFQSSLDELYINNRLENATEAYYRTQFLTISDGNQLLRRPGRSGMWQRYPVEFERVLNAGELSMFNKEMLWIKLVFGPEFTADILEDLTISINCFPVMNRRLNETSHQLQSHFNIIPLLSAEQFLSVSRVEGTSPAAKGDKEYKFYAFDQFDNSQKGTYTVRHGDLERFDSRNALEYMNYLVDLLRDESRAFAAIGQDFIASLIKNLNQSIAQIEQKIKMNIATFSTTPAYLLINPVAEGDTIFTQFWTSNGDIGNSLRSGSRMEVYDGASLRREGVLLMTATTGGSNKLKNTETLAAYKHVLISRSRLVTPEDIKSYCHYFFSNKAHVASIELKRGIGISARPKEGLIPTVDIVVTTHKNEQAGAPEWEGIKHELLVNLESLSAVSNNYRVFVN